MTTQPAGPDPAAAAALNMAQQAAEATAATKKRVDELETATNAAKAGQEKLAGDVRTIADSHGKLAEMVAKHGTLAERFEARKAEVDAKLGDHAGKLERVIWLQYMPVPISASFEHIADVKDRLGDRGIIRSHPFSPGQGSPWQSFCTQFGTEEAILLGMDEPEYLLHVLEQIVRKTLRVTEMWKGTPADMVEVGGGAGSSTVISPDFYRRFGLPFDHIKGTAL